MYGFHTELQGSTSTERGNQFADAASVSAQVLRCPFEYGRVRGGVTDPGSYDFSAYDDIVSRAHTAGMALVFVLRDTPQWVSGSSDALLIPNAGSGSTDATFRTFTTAWQGFATVAATRYKAGGTGNPNGVVIYWEIWNEPNLRANWHNTGSTAGPDADQYSYFYAALRTSILAADASAKVATGAVTSWTASGANDVTGKVILSKLITDTRTLDYVGVHPYQSSTQSPDFHDCSAKNNFDDIADCIRVLDAGGYTSAKLMLTEWGGWDSGAITQATQAKYVQLALQMIDRRWSARVEVAQYFLLKDQTGFTGVGLFSSTDVARTSATTWSNFMAGSYSQAYGAAGLSRKAGSFALNTSTGAQAITGLGFKPKALIFYATLLTADGYADGTTMCFGVSDGSTDRSMSSFAGDAVSTTTPARRIAADISALSAATPTVAFAFNVASLDSDGFTITVVTAPGSAWLVRYVAIGGSNISHAVVGDYMWKASNNVSGHEIAEVGFAPDLFVLFEELGGQANFSSLPQQIAGSATQALGVMDGSANAGSHARFLLGRTTPNTSQATASYQSGKLYCGSSTNTITPTSVGVNGPVVTLAGQGAANTLLFFLALKGGHWKVQQDSQKTSTGSKAKTGTGFQPELLLVFGTQLTANADASGDGDLVVGASDGSNTYSVWTGGQNNVSPSNQASRTVSGKLALASTAAATTNAEASLASFDPDGYSLTYTSADATARLITVVTGATVPANVNGAASISVRGGEASVARKQAIASHTEP